MGVPPADSKVRGGLWRGAASVIVLCALALAGCASPTPPPEAAPLVWPPPPEQPRYYHERTIFGSTDIQELSNVEWWRYIATGETTRGKGLEKPFGVLAVNGRVFVGDTVARRVSVYDVRGKRYFEFGDKGPGTLAKPLGMTADRAGNIYVVDGTARRIHVYNYDGRFVRDLGGGEFLQRPTGVAASPDGSRIYVVDTGGVGSSEHRVRVFDGGGIHLFDFGTRGPGEGEFNLPTMAAVGADGSVYVVDSGNFRVQKFTPEGRYLLSFGQIGRRLGQFSRPKGIAVDDEGKVFVIDAAFGNFQIFDSSGQLLLFIGERGEDGGPGKFMLPAGISVDRDGRVYVVDQYIRKLEIYRPAGVEPIGATTARSALSR